MHAQALSRGSGAFGGARRRSGSGRLARSGSLDGALQPKKVHLELELVAIGVGLQFVELEEGRKVQLHLHNPLGSSPLLYLLSILVETVCCCMSFGRGLLPSTGSNGCAVLQPFPAP